MIGGSIAGAISAGSSLIAIRLLPDSAIAPSTKGSYLVAIVRRSVRDSSRGVRDLLDTVQQSNATATADAKLGLQATA